MCRGPGRLAISDEQGIHWAESLVEHSKAEEVLGNGTLVYEVRAINPGVDFLRSRKCLEVFGYEVHKLLHDLRRVYRQRHPIHVFAAVPAPVAIEFGRTLKGFDPEFVVYEYRKVDCTYVRALTVNVRSR